MTRQFVLYTGLLGSDQFLPLDGRWSIRTAAQKAREHLARLRKHIYPGLETGFQICCGSIRQPHVLYHTERA